MNAGSGIVASAEAAWEEPVRASASAAPVLAVEGFEGPLDWLLELARVERIDLRRLSILALVDAFAAALEQALSSPERADLSRWGEFLAMAAQLTLLRSRLLLPPDAAAAKSARVEAEALRRQLLEGDAMRRAASWLDGRQQLGRDVFGRGVSAHQRQASARLADIVDLLRACLVLLRVPEHGENYTVPLPPLWRVQDALARITRLLGKGVEGELGAFLPRVEPNGLAYGLQCRSAVASTLLAGLELARADAVALQQDQPLQPIRVCGTGRMLANAEPASASRARERAN